MCVCVCDTVTKGRSESSVLIRPFGSLGMSHDNLWTHQPIFVKRDVCALIVTLRNSIVLGIDPSFSMVVGHKNVGGGQNSKQIAKAHVGFNFTLN